MAAPLRCCSRRQRHRRYCLIDRWMSACRRPAIALWIAASCRTGSPGPCAVEGRRSAAGGTCAPHNTAGGGRGGAGAALGTARRRQSPARSLSRCSRSMPGSQSCHSPPAGRCFRPLGSHQPRAPPVSAIVGRECGTGQATKEGIPAHTDQRGARHSRRPWETQRDATQRKRTSSASLERDILRGPMPIPLRLRSLCTERSCGGGPSLRHTTICGGWGKRSGVSVPDAGRFWKLVTEVSVWPSRGERRRGFFGSETWV